MSLSPAHSQSNRRTQQTHTWACTQHTPPFVVDFTDQHLCSKTLSLTVFTWFYYHMNQSFLYQIWCDMIRGPYFCGGATTSASRALTVWCFPDFETHLAHLCGILVTASTERTLHRWEVRSNEAAQRQLLCFGCQFISIKHSPTKIGTDNNV